MKHGSNTRRATLKYLSNCIGFPIYAPVRFHLSSMQCCSSKRRRSSRSSNCIPLERLRCSPRTARDRSGRPPSLPSIDVLTMAFSGNLQFSQAQFINRALHMDTYRKHISPLLLQPSQVGGEWANRMELSK